MRFVITIHRAICDSAGTWGVERRNIKTVNCYAAEALRTELGACSSQFSSPRITVKFPHA